MSNEEIEKFNDCLLVFTKHYNGIILDDRELNVILDTPYEYVNRINEIIREDQLKKKCDGSIERYIANKTNINGIKLRARTDFDNRKNINKFKEALSFSALISLFDRYYNGINLTSDELDIIASTSFDEIEKVEEIIRQEKLRKREDGSYLRYIRNRACLYGKRFCFDNTPVKRTIYAVK